MIADIFNIVQKEWKEIFLMRGSLRSGLLNIGIIVALVGIFFPLQAGPVWLNSPLGLATWSWLPLFLVMSSVADSFAGERERHTLETLLASRLSDRTILFGKLASSVLYGWSIVILSMLLGAITVNIAHPAGGIRFYPLNIFFGGLLLSLLGTLLMGGIGILVSLRSSTVRQAYQKMSVAFMVIWFVPLMALQFLPASITAPLIESMANIDMGQVVTIAMLVLLVVDVLLIFLATRQFRRDRLILD